MTIDEAIAYEREVANSNKTKAVYDNEFLKRFCTSKEACIEFAEEHEQLAEWLEELKAYREIGTVEECKGCVLEILEAYNKAIDDFEQKLLEKAPRNYVGDLELGGSVGFLSANTVTKIAEQLKAGVMDERK